MSRARPDLCCGPLSPMNGRAAAGTASSPCGPRFRYNQDFRSVFAIVPGTIMFLLILIPAMLTAVGVVREKEMGSITNVYASPATVGEYLIGKQLPYVAIGFVSFVVAPGDSPPPCLASSEPDRFIASLVRGTHLRVRRDGLRAISSRRSSRRKSLPSSRRPSWRDPRARIFRGSFLRPRHSKALLELSVSRFPGTLVSDREPRRLSPKGSRRPRSSARLPRCSASASRSSCSPAYRSGSRTSCDVPMVPERLSSWSEGDRLAFSGQ